ncbi:GntR family transcriptional regulator [Nocardioides kongjuensis]|uniref:DNA-binding GntR family transcriptional regulator n=1 Tax=Nocardioides kongjuensis TaxID=349522 RepID=A0A852RF32_9ACTN|nr:DNA-binding GntR family transcriptional regulator [Nocardioides kongjuensis]
MTLSRSVLREQVKEIVIQRILDGTYRPGQRVVELALAQEFGVSQAPVREALRDLEAMRFIESAPYKGSWVREVSREELAESYPVRAVLEELAGQLAAPQVDNSTLRQLEAEFQNMMDAARSQDQHGVLVHDARFHEIIIETAGNRVLLDSWSGLRIEAYTLVSVIKSHHDLLAIANTHLPILDALRQRDGDLAGKVMRQHIDHFLAELLGDDLS